METLIIQVNFNAFIKDGKPELGITVESPYSVAMRRRQQQTAKEYRNHDYQNFHSFATNNNSNSNLRQANDISRMSGKKMTTINVSSKQQLQNIPGEQMQRGLQITNIQPGSVIDRCGQFKIDDIIVEVNGVNFQNRHFVDAQQILKDFVTKHSSHGPLLLKVLRRAASSSSLPSTTGSVTTVIERNNSLNRISSPASSSKNNELTKNQVKHIKGPSYTRRIGTKHNIQLTKSRDGGFGFKIAERDNMFGANKPIYITAITTTGSAYRDGRLKEGDMLLEINGFDLAGMSQPDVTKMLKNVGFDETVNFVISRQDDIIATDDHSRDYVNISTENNTDNFCDNTKSLIDLDVPDQDDSVFTDTNHQFERKIDSLLNMPNIDGPGTYAYDIPINDTKSAGLGLSFKKLLLDGQDLGIWIKNVITGGAAWKDGRLQPNDQILAINGMSLAGLSIDEVRSVVCHGIGPEATPNTIRLNIHRRDPAVVDKILHGTNNRIENFDLLANGQSKTLISSDKIFNNSQESYQASYEHTAHDRSQSFNENSSSSSNNKYSLHDSAISPQTQASNSMKFSNSCNKSDQDNSDKTNDTSSAISQITDFTTVPTYGKTSPDDKNHLLNNDSQTATLPKTLEFEDSMQDTDPILSNQSWDDESMNSMTGEERFQRDGFGRQSISEKRHAQLQARNTDTFKRNQKMREERERQLKQQQLEEQFARAQLEDANMNGPVYNPQLHRVSNSITATNIQSYHENNKQPYPENPIQMIDCMFIPPAGSVRVARNRRFNESFRAAVDRSYDSSISDSIRCENANPSSNNNNRISSSIANSTTSTSNEERCLLNGNRNINNHHHQPQQQKQQPSQQQQKQQHLQEQHTHKKSSSLFTKFLKFGSMKKIKKKNKEEKQTSDKNIDSKSINNDTSGRDTNRSQATKNVHSRNYSFANVQEVAHPTNPGHQIVQNGYNTNAQWQPQVHVNHMAPVQAPNGLWVANSPILDNQYQYQYQDGIYGGYGHQHQMIPQMLHHNQHHIQHQHQNQQQPFMMSNPTPFIPPMNSNHQSLNGIIPQQLSVLQGHQQTMTQQHLHNQPLQHIYYYDF